MCRGVTLRDFLRRRAVKTMTDQPIEFQTALELRDELDDDQEDSDDEQQGSAEVFNGP